MTSARIRQLALYYTTNTAFAVSLYYGLYLENAGALNVAEFLGWYACFGGLIMLLALGKKDELVKVLYTKNWHPAAPVVVDFVFDIAVMYTLVHYDYIWLPIFYAIHMFVMHEVRNAMKDVTYKILMEKT